MGFIEINNGKHMKPKGNHLEVNEHLMSDEWWVVKKGLSTLLLLIICVYS